MSRKVLVLFLVLSVLVLFPGCSRDEGAVVSDPPVGVVNCTGNTNGNLNNGGLAAGKDGWIYYVENAPLADAGNTLDLPIENLIKKMRSDGSGVDSVGGSIVGMVSNLIIDGNWIYYCVKDYDNRLQSLHKRDLQGTKDVLLASFKRDDYAERTFFVADGWVYYLKQDRLMVDVLYKIRTDGTEETKLLEFDKRARVSDLNLRDGYFYFLLCDYDLMIHSIIRLRADGSGLTILAEFDSRKVWTEDLLVEGDALYYRLVENLSDDAGLYRMSLDGKEHNLVTGYENNDFKREYFNVSGGTVFHLRYFEGMGILMTLCRLDADGTETILYSYDSALNSLFDINLVEDSIVFRTHTGSIRQMVTHILNRDGTWLKP